MDQMFSDYYRCEIVNLFNDRISVKNNETKTSHLTNKHIWNTVALCWENYVITPGKFKAHLVWLKWSDEIVQTTTI